MLSFDYKEINLFNEIINLKIINKNDILSNYKITASSLKYSLDKINYLLGLMKAKRIIEKDGYICHYMLTNSKVFEIEKLISLKNDARRSLIYLYLFCSEKRFNLYAFTKLLNIDTEDKNYVKKDLKSVLASLGIGYEEYKNSFKTENKKISETPNVNLRASLKSNIIKNKTTNYERTRESLVKSTLLECCEKIISEAQTQLEQKKIQIIEQELKIKNLNYIYEKMFDFFDKYKKIASKSLKYDIFTFIILNLKNPKINRAKRVTSNNYKFREDEGYNLLKGALNSIEKSENQKIYSYFIMKIYKLILKKIKSENIFNSEIQIKNAILDILNTEKSEKFETLEIYKIAESVKKYEDEEYLNKKIESVNITNQQTETLLVFDFEYDEFTKNIELLKRFLNFFNITKIIKFDDLKSEIPNDKNYKQILIFSNYNIKSIIVNYTEKPIFFMQLPNKLTKIQKKVYFDQKFLEIQQAFNIYNNS